MFQLRAFLQQLSLKNFKKFSRLSELVVPFANRQSTCMYDVMILFIYCDIFELIGTISGRSFNFTISTFQTLVSNADALALEWKIRKIR